MRDNAAHLRRTADWIRVLAPTASLAVLLAGLTHDMERAYPVSTSQPVTIDHEGIWRTL
jgi:hypothetical protein